MTSPKNVCNLILGAIFAKSKHIQQLCEGFHTFCPNFPGFSPNLKFWGCACTPTSYTSSTYRHGRN